MTTMASNYEHLDLWELNYMFAVEKIDPSVGRIKARKVIWGNDNIPQKQEIELVDCRELAEGGSHEG